MAKKIVYNLEIDTKNSMKSINDLTNELDVMKNELKTLTVGSDAFNELKNKVIAADSQIKNLNKSIEGMDFDQIAGEAGKFAGGVGAITGAFMLMGDTESKTMKELQENLNKSLGLVMGVKGAIEVWTSSTKLLIPVQKALNAAMKANPIGLVVTAVAALAVGVALLVKTYDKSRSSIIEFNDGMIKEKVNAELLFVAINNTTTSTKERGEAIDAINKKYGTYLPHLLTEKSSQEEIAKAYDLVSDAIWNSLINRVKLQELEEKLTPLIQEEIELKQKYNNLSDDEKSSIEELVKLKKVLNETDLTSKENMDARNKVIELEGKINENSLSIYNKLQTAGENRKDLIKKISDNYDGLLITMKEYNHDIKEITNSTINYNSSLEDLQKTIDKIVNDDALLKKWEKDKKAAKEVADAVKEIGIALNEEEEWVQDWEEKGTFWERMFGDEEGIQRAKEMAVSMGIDIANQISDAVFTVQQNNLQYEYDKKLEMLDEYMNNELEKYEGNEEKQLTIKKDYANKQKALEREKLKEQQKLQIAQAIAAGALGIAGTWAQWATIPAPAGPGFAIAQTAAIVAATAIQVATIKNQKFAKGGLLNGPSHADGGILTQFGEMEGGEAVINKQAVSAFAPVLSTINQATGGNPIGNETGSLIDYDLLASKLNDKKVYVVSSEMTNQQGKDADIEDRATIS